MMNLSDKLRDLRPFVADLKKFINKEVTSFFKVTSKKLLETRDGKKYLLMTFTDRTGSVRAVDWYNAERNDEKVYAGCVVKVKGRVVIFEGRLQLNVNREEDSMVLLDESAVPFDRFVARTDEDPEELFSEAMKLIGSIRAQDLRNLTETIFKSLSKEIMNSPAGLKVHHAYIGGLIEHSLTVAKIADFVSQIYNLERDLMVAGALLHDIGKIREYEVKPTGIEITTEGELKGHIILGVEIVKSFAKRLKIPNKKSMELEHIIASHHGEMEHGSPVLPKTPEALAIHFIENMDSKLARFRDLVKDLEGAWSEFDRNLGRRIYIRENDDKMKNG